MKATYTNILIDRDPMTKIPKVVPSWEVPVYQSLFGEDAIIVGEDSEVDVDYDGVPAAKDVLGRMVAIHGVDADTKQPHAVLAYGMGRQGERALQDALNEAHGVKGKGKSKAAADDGDDAAK